MDFALSPRAEELRKRLEAFMDESVYPNEALYHRQITESGDPHLHAPILDELKAHARERGLWNLFLPHATEWTEGLSNLDYAPLAEITGRSHLAPEALNCAAPPHRQQSMILVPTDTPGLANVRSLPVFGYDDNEGHCELVFDDVRVPADHLLGEEGGGFAMAQARLGPGRIHHCMRAIGVAERALELMCRRGGGPGGVRQAPGAPGG